MPCRGVCVQHMCEKQHQLPMYSENKKRCNACELFIRWDGRKCPCCGMKLRTRPRAGKYRRRYMDLKIGIYGGGRESRHAEQ